MPRHGTNIESDRRISRKFEKAHLKQIKFALNDNTDADVIAFLDTVENKRAYLLGLIRADMAKNNPAE